MTGTTTTTPALLTTEEMCKLLRVSRATLYADVRAGKIPGVIWLGSRCLRFSRHAVERWLEQRDEELDY